MIEPYFSDDRTTVYLGKVENVLPTLPDASVDAIVTDPPYEISFMSRTWDASGIAYNVEMWAHCWRVLKPGGHLVAFGAPRTYHRMAVAIEDAGFEIRDSMHWIYGSGFPKSLDVGKAIDRAAGAQREAIDRAAGAQREVIGDKLDQPGYHLRGHNSGTGAFGSGIAATTPETRLRSAQITAPATEDARRWEGWGTALKPSHEPIVLARKPLAGTVAGNVLEHGTGALNIDGCRVATSAADAEAMKRANTPGSGRMKAGGSPIGTFVRSNPTGAMDTTKGRWPTNLVLTHSATCAEACAADCPVAELDRQSGYTVSRRAVVTSKPGGVFGGGAGLPSHTGEYGQDDEGASRYFPVFRYEAKAPTSERPKVDGVAHETVKPLALMRWLVRLVTQPGGTVLDPFLGSGTTAEACAIEGFQCVGIERDEKYIPLIKARLGKPLQAVLGFEEPA